MFTHQALVTAFQDAPNSEHEQYFMCTCCLLSRCLQNADTLVLLAHKWVTLSRHFYSFNKISVRGSYHFSTMVTSSSTGRLGPFHGEDQIVITKAVDVGNGPSSIFAMYEVDKCETLGLPSHLVLS